MTQKELDAKMVTLEKEFINNKVIIETMIRNYQTAIAKTESDHLAKLAVLKEQINLFQTRISKEKARFQEEVSNHKKKINELENEKFPRCARLNIFEYVLGYGSRHVRNITIKPEKSGSVGGAEPYLQISLILIKGEIVPVP